MTSATDAAFSRALRMNNPELELRQIILDLTESDDAVKHKATVDKYFTTDAEFIHPLCNLYGGPNSRESLKNIYAVYKFFTRDVQIDIQKITVDSNCTRAVIEMEESLSAKFLPILRVKHLKIITILDFERVDNRFYIKRQYDAFPFDHLSDVLPFGFLYSWYKSSGAVIGNMTGGLLQKLGLW